MIFFLNTFFLIFLVYCSFSFLSPKGGREPGAMTPRESWGKIFIYVDRDGSLSRAAGHTPYATLQQGASTVRCQWRAGEAEVGGRERWLDPACFRSMSSATEKEAALRPRPHRLRTCRRLSVQNSGEVFASPRDTFGYVHIYIYLPRQVYVCLHV